jgi:hypothetical protein
MSLSIRPLVSAVLVILIALGATLSSPEPARAADPLAVGVSCEGTGGGSTYANFFCDAYSTGGTGGETYTWSGNSYLSFTVISGGFALGRCRVGYIGRVTVTVRDSSGATASASTLFRCYAIAP